MSKFHWNDLTRCQTSAIEFIGGIDESLLDDITKLSLSHNTSDMFGALTSTMSALMALTGSNMETPAPTPPAQDTGAPGPKDTKALSKSAFIVHGHDDAMKRTVARFISGLGLTSNVSVTRWIVGQLLSTNPCACIQHQRIDGAGSKSNSAAMVPTMRLDCANVVDKWPALRYEALEPGAIDRVLRHGGVPMQTRPHVRRVAV
jgi:hypothetical protein